MTTPVMCILESRQRSLERGIHPAGTANRKRVYRFAKRARAGNKIVAQVSNLLYRSASSLRTLRSSNDSRPLGCAADWKSAVQQVGNLRYVPTRRPCQQSSPRALLILLSLISFSAVADDWPMLGHDAARSGGTPTEIRPPFARKWYRLFPDEGIQSGVQPVIAGGKVFLGTLAGVLHAMDAETGKDIWTFKAGGPILHAAAVGDGRVFFGSADGFIRALYVTDGKPAWSLRTDAAVWNAPAIERGLVLIGGRDGRVYAIESKTGKARWVKELGAPLLNSPAIDPKAGRIYIGSEAMWVHALALETGREIWKSDRLPGASMRGYHPVIAPDGSVLVTTAPVIGYDRFQALLLDMARTVFGDFASWRHKKEENDKLRAANFELMAKPETYRAQLDYLRDRLTQEPAFQTFFVLDPASGRQRFVAPVVASESMNGPGAPPLVTPDGRVIIKYQVLLRSRYEHYSPFLNVGYFNMTNGYIAPIMDQSRTYGWHDSLLLVHDEQSQLSLADHLLLNTHQDNVNGLDLETLKGFPDPLAINIHEPVPGEALAIRMEAWRGHELSPGNEWLMRGTAVYGGGSVLDVPVAIAGDSFYYLPTHEINSGCALIAYHSDPGAASPKKTLVPEVKLSDEEWRRIQDASWDWDTLATPRLKNLLDSLPGKVPGTTAAPLTVDAEKRVSAIPDSALDEFIWKPALPNAPAAGQGRGTAGASALTEKLRTAVGELLSQSWRPLVLPAAKAPEESYRFFNDPSETVYTLMLAYPFLDATVRRKADAFLGSRIAAGLPRMYEPNGGEARVPYDVPLKQMRVVDEFVRDDLARLYPLWLWSRTEVGASFVHTNWNQLRSALHTVVGKVDDDCGNSRLAGLIAFCRLAKDMKDGAAVDEGLPLTREAMRARLRYEFAYTRGGVIRTVPNGRSVIVRWRRLTPDVGRFLAAFARPIEEHLMTVYVDDQRPGWWIAWNVEQLMRNEAPFQLPTTPLEIFTARALILAEPAEKLKSFVDIPWSRADEYYIQKLALTLRAKEK